jgi:hypothetical protein
MDFLSFRSNPQATGNGVQQDYTGNPYDLPNFEILFTTNDGGTQATFTPDVPNDVLDFLTYRITDGLGNQMTGMANVAAIAATNINTSSLNQNTDWTVFVKWGANDGAYYNTWSFALTGAKGSAAETKFKRVPGDIQLHVLVYVDDVLSSDDVYINGDHIDFTATIPQNSNTYALVYMKNTATEGEPQPLTVRQFGLGTSVLTSKGTTFADSPIYPLVIAAGLECPQYQKIIIDTTNTGVFATEEIIILSDSPTYPTTTISLTGEII